ncbi:MAG: tRNA(Ile)-lysidine synthetase, partial [Eubacterium sp.]|nr:tRNA(Ile)-lysidine synthetase [Eubacterium sp.]
MNRRIREELLGADGVCPGDTGIVAVSGGADSVFLLRILESLAEELELQLVVVHVHHG